MYGMWGAEVRGERWSRSRAPDCQSRGRWFNLTCRCFTEAISFTSHLPVSFGRDTKNGGPFCLVSMPGEVKDPTMTIMVSKLTGGH